MKRFLTLIAAIAVLAAGLSLAVVQAKGVSGKAAPVVGAGRVEEALEFLGSASQNGAGIAVQGYFNHVSGLPDASLFTGSTRTAATARFTFTSVGQINARYVQGNMIVTTSTQVLRIVFGKQLVGSLSVHFQDILSVQTPNAGIETGTAWAVQTKSGSFRIGNRRYRFGRVGLSERFFTTGEGKRTATTPLRSEFSLAGNAMIIP
jgi:hypothetical protein